MGLPVIRLVEHTDDGCTLYEFLCCGVRIESRSRLVLGSVEGDGLVPGWNLCPNCGTSFEEAWDTEGAVWERKKKRYAAMQSHHEPAIYVLEEMDSEPEELEWGQELWSEVFRGTLRLVHADRQRRRRYSGDSSLRFRLRRASRPASRLGGLPDCSVT